MSTPRTTRRPSTPVNTEAVEHADRLRRILDNANTIRFGVWKPELFGTIRETDPTSGEVRFLLWLYVNGEPIWNPDAFTFRNPTGVAPTGSGAPEPEPADNRA